MQWYEDLHWDTVPTSTNVHKGISHCKKNRHLIVDETDSESDNNNNEVTDQPWLDKWTDYINTNKFVPEGMGVICWWGYDSILSHIPSLTLFYRFMARVIQHGARLCVTTLPLWHHQSQARTHSLLPASQSASAVIGSKATSLRRSSASRASYIKTYYFGMSSLLHRMKRTSTLQIKTRQL